MTPRLKASRRERISGELGEELPDLACLLRAGEVEEAAGAKGNVITLTGHVRTWAEHDAVLGAAWMARGVIDVRDNLQVTG